MKRMISKILCIIMALCLFLGAMPIMSFANNEPDGFVEVEGMDAIDFSPEVQLEMSNNVTDGMFADKFYSNGADANTPYRFFNQLTDNQKLIYQAILNAGVKESILLPFEYPANPIVGSGVSYNDAVTNVKTILSNDIVAAISAVAEDNPMIFWLNGFSYSFSYYQGSSGSTYYVFACDITLTIRLDTNSYANFTVVQQKYNELATAVNNFKVNGINHYEKIKSINDQLCDIVTYPDVQGYFSDGSPYYGPMAHQPTGALLNGSAVCEGYAEALKLICDREGIPCITVLGTGNGGAHKWNYVKMDDGKWYMVDTTWNDQITYKLYDWFITGSDFDGGDHVNSGKMFSADFTLVYPTLSTDNYSMGVLRANTPDLAYNNTNNILYVGKGNTNYLNYLGLPSNISGTVSSSAVTGARLTVTNNNTAVTRTYTVAMRGDINATDTVTTDDYNLVVSTATAKNNVTQNTAKFYAGDMTQDGAIDGFDAIALDLYLEDTLKFN